MKRCFCSVKTKKNKKKTIVIILNFQTIYKPCIIPFWDHFVMYFFDIFTREKQI